MNISLAERRQIENEMIFRRTNEKVGDDLGVLDEMHIEEGNPDLVWDESLELHFKCECSDENCEIRIPMLLEDYKKIHIDRDTFMVVPGHQINVIEKVLEETADYNVVKKNNSTAEPSDVLNVTDINN
jgi:hypothetical protein